VFLPKLILQQHFVFHLNPAPEKCNITPEPLKQRHHYTSLWSNSPPFIV
jgi:hypothetical protein